MPVKTRIDQPNGNYFAIMSAMTGRDNMAMVKMIGRHSLKPAEARTSMMSDLMLYEADTGVLQALVDGEYLTTIRTGATAAYSALLFVKKDFSVIGLIGLGNIMTVFLECLMSSPAFAETSRDLTIKLFAHHGQERRFQNRFKKYPNIHFEVCNSYEDTIRNSELVVSAVTQTDSLFANDSCFSIGVTVIPISTRGFQNCDLFFDKVFTDEIEQIRGFQFFDCFKYLANTGDVLQHKKDGRSSDDERIIVYNYGLAILDLYFATQLLKNADISPIKYDFPAEKYFI